MNNKCIFCNTKAETTNVEDEPVCLFHQYYTASGRLMNTLDHVLKYFDSRGESNPDGGYVVEDDERLYKQ